MLKTRGEFLYRTLPRKGGLLIASFAALAFAFTHDGVDSIEENSPVSTAEYKAEQTGNRFVELPREGSESGLVADVGRFCAELGMGIRVDSDGVVCYFTTREDLPYPVELGEDEDSTERREDTLLGFCMDADGEIDKVAPDEQNGSLEDLVFACELKG